MIPVVVWFKFSCGSSIAMRGTMPALPRVGDSILPSMNDSPDDWVVERVSHNMYGDMRVELDVESRPEGPQLEMNRRDRTAFRKQMEKAGWSVASEYHAKTSRPRQVPIAPSSD